MGESFQMMHKWTFIEVEHGTAQATAWKQGGDIHGVCVNSWKNMNLRACGSSKNTTVRQVKQSPGSFTHN